MIQRVQSIYLFLAAILITAVYFLPLLGLEGTGEILYTLYTSGVVEDGQQTLILSTWPVMVMVTAIALLLFVNIFLYKRRIIQMRICVYSILLILGLYFLVWFYQNQFREQIPVEEVQYFYGLIFPLIAIVFIWMAFKGIRKDERLVRSYDRIR